LDQFVKITEPLIPKDWMQECGISSQQAYLPHDEAVLLQSLSTTGMQISTFSLLF